MKKNVLTLMAMLLSLNYGVANAEGGRGIGLPVCMSCHSSTDRAPDITKLSSQDILSKLQAYRERKDKAFMVVIAQKLSDENMEVLAKTISKSDPHTGKE